MDIVSQQIHKPYYHLPVLCDVRAHLVCSDEAPHRLEDWIECFKQLERREDTTEKEGSVNKGQIPTELVVTRHVSWYATNVSE